MELCANRRMDMIKEGTLKVGPKQKYRRSHDLSQDEVWDIIRDAQHVKRQFDGTKKMDDLTLRCYTAVANCDWIEYVFDWCADHDVDEFPLNLRVIRQSGTASDTCLYCYVQE